MTASSVSLLPREGQSTALDELAGRLESDLLAPAKRAGLKLPVLGASRPPAGREFWQAPTGRWWVFDDWRRDPLAAEHGGVPAPPEVRERLAMLLHAGFAPDLVWLGHECPDGFRPGQPLPPLGPATQPGKRPRSLRTTAPPALKRSISGADMLRATWQSTASVLTLAMKVGRATGRAVTALDPVILAGVRHPREPVVVWVEVARWSW